MGYEHPLQRARAAFEYEPEPVPWALPYAHVICELTPTLRQQLEHYDFTPTPDGAGYFVFNSQLRVWIEVLSFDKMIDDAKRRNAVFFDKLGVRPIG